MDVFSCVMLKTVSLPNEDKIVTYTAILKQCQDHFSKSENSVIGEPSKSAKLRLITLMACGQ